MPGIYLEYKYVLGDLSSSFVAQGKRAGPITQRSVDRNNPKLLHSWPSGLRRHVQVVVSKEAWVQTPQNASFCGSKLAQEILWFIARMHSRAHSKRNSSVGRAPD
jgi:hypothetical protein